MTDSVLFFNIDDGLFKACFGQDNEWNCTLKSLPETCSPRELDDALSVVKSVVIDTIGGPYWERIKQYYEAGGLVVYFGIIGEFDAPTKLSYEFGLEWRFSAYTRHEYRLTDVGRAVLGHAVTEQVYSKSNLLSVPASDSILVPQPPYPSFQSFLDEEWDEEDYSREEMVAKYNDMIERLNDEVPLAMHQATHGGRIAYLGFVNDDGNIPKFVRALCTCSKTVP